MVAASFRAFGPQNFHYQCAICHMETEEGDSPPDDFSVFPCNNGKARIEMIDYVLRRENAFLHFDGRVNQVALNRLRQAFPEYTRVLESQNGPKRFTTIEGYLNLDGLHVACLSCIDQQLNQNRICAVCRADCNEGDVKLSSELTKRIKRAFPPVQEQPPPEPQAARPMPP